MCDPNEALSRPQFDGTRYSNPDSFTGFVSPSFWKLIKFKWTTRNDGGGEYPSNETEVGKLSSFRKLFRSYFPGIRKHFLIFSSTPPYQCIDPAST
jgi:hypothetical protein